MILDFIGLYIVCICGFNGVGKFFLLEVIVWVIWGNSWVVIEDDIISLGEKEIWVDFIFFIYGNIYCVICGCCCG